MNSHRIVRAILLVVWYAGIAIVATWPLLPVIRTHIISHIGDNLQYAWYFGWFPDAVFHRHIWPFANPDFNWPHGASLAYDDYVPLQVLLGLPFAMLGGPILGYNCSVLLSYFLTGLTMHWWVRNLVERTGGDTLRADLAGLLAGSLYACCTFRIAITEGHLHLMATQWLPLYIAALWWWFSDLDPTRRIPWPRLACVVGMIAIVAGSSLYYLVMSVVVTALFIVGVMMFSPKGWLRAKLNFRVLATRTALLGVACALPALLVTAPYIALRMKGEFHARPIEESIGWAASPLRFFLPTIANPVFGKLVVPLPFDHNHPGFRIYLGLVPICLLAAGWMLHRRETKKSADREQPSLDTSAVYTPPVGRVLAWLIMCCFILALGPRLKLTDDQPATIPLPSALQQMWGWPQIRIPLPGALLTKFMPFYNTVRTNTRWTGYVALFAVALAGISLGRMILPHIRANRVAVLFTVLLIFVGIVDQTAINRPLTLYVPRPVDYWIRDHVPAGAPIIEFPFSTNRDPIPVFGTLTHRHPIVGGLSRHLYPNEFGELSVEMNGFPDQRSADAIRRLGIKHVIVNSGYFADFEPVDEQIRGFGMKSLGKLRQFRMYEVQ